MGEGFPALLFLPGMGSAQMPSPDHHPGGGMASLFLAGRKKPRGQTENPIHRNVTPSPG
jgi:hypothetical protein